MSRLTDVRSAELPVGIGLIEPVSRTVVIAEFRDMVYGERSVASNSGSYSEFLKIAEVRVIDGDDHEDHGVLFIDRVTRIAHGTLTNALDFLSEPR